MIHHPHPHGLAVQCGADAWLKGLASRDQRRRTGSGSALGCVIQMHVFFTYITVTWLTDSRRVIVGIKTSQETVAVSS